MIIVRFCIVVGGDGVLAQRVYVVWTHPIFHEAVRLLLSHPDVEWVGASSDYADAKDEILRLRPDTIVVESVGEGVPVEVMDLLEGSAWYGRIFGLSLADNELNVYHREHWTVGRSDDLLRLVLGDSSRVDRNSRVL